MTTPKQPRKGKGKKKPIEPAAEPQSPVEIVPEDEPIMAKEVVRTVRTYERQVPVSEPEDEGEGEFEGGEEESEDFDEPEDPNEALLREMGLGGSDWTMTVYRLPNYQRDGRSDARAKKVMCGTIPFGEQYAEDIQARWARPNTANDFLVYVRRDRHIVKHFVVSVEPPLPEVIAEQRRQENPNAPAVIFQSEGSSGLSQVKESFRLVTGLMREMQGLTGFVPGAAAAPAAPVAVVNPRREITATEAVMRLVEEEPDTLARVTNRLLGFDKGPAAAPEGEADNIWTVLKTVGGELVRQLPIGQMLAQGIRGMNGAMPNAANYAGMGTLPPGVAPVAATGMPAPTPEPAPPAQAPPEIQLLAYVVQSFAGGVDPVIVAEQVNAFADQNPSLEPHLEAFINNPPEFAVGIIRGLLPGAAPVLDRPGVNIYIARLQTALAGEEETTEPNEQTVNQPSRSTDATESFS